MRCFVENIISEGDLHSDIKSLIPDAALRRRMSRVVKMGVSTAVECLGGVEHIDDVDAILTATGWGCLADSERFLRNVIGEGEQLLNPTPFIQSTFNTVGGQVAILRHNHCYNVTYVNRGHSFEDALLDAALRLEDGLSHDVLLVAFDEMTPSQHHIMERMGVFRHRSDGEGCVAVRLTAEPTPASRAVVSSVAFPQGGLSPQQCIERYAKCGDAKMLCADSEALYPTASAMMFKRAVEMIGQGEREVVVYNNLYADSAAAVVVECVG